MKATFELTGFKLGSKTLLIVVGIAIWLMPTPLNVFEGKAACVQPLNQITISPNAIPIRRNEWLHIPGVSFACITPAEGETR